VKALSAANLGALLLPAGAFAAALAGPYPPSAGQPGSTALAATDPRFVAWVSAEADVALERGPRDVSDPGSPSATFGSERSVLGRPDADEAATPPAPQQPDSVVSLGDGGRITLSFSPPITDAAGPDFAVFENSFSDTFLELAFVEVSSNGRHFVRFPTTSLTQTTTQIDQNNPQARSVDPTEIDGFAGKYRAGFGTPFDLADLAGSPGLDVAAVTHVRIIDVVGAIDPAYGTRDSAGRLINDPWPTPFVSGGFDLDAVGVLHQVPEPTTAALFGFTALVAFSRRHRSPSGG